MEAVTKTGKIIKGKIAEILLKKGSASPFASEAPVKKAPKKEPKKVPKKK